MLKKIRHILNPLHVYCRLVGLNIVSIRKARIISKIYDKLVYRLLYPSVNRRR